MKIDRSSWRTDYSRAKHIDDLLFYGFYVPECDFQFARYYFAALQNYCPFCGGELYRTVLSKVDESDHLVYGIRNQCWGCDLDVSFFESPGVDFEELEFPFLDYCHSKKM